MVMKPNECEVCGDPVLDGTSIHTRCMDPKAEEEAVEDEPTERNDPHG